MTDTRSSTVRNESIKAEEPIFSLAWDCDGLIRDCVGKEEVESPTKRRLEDYKRRFIAWWEYLGVFAERSVNLDRRLYSKPEIRDIVVRLLLILRRNLTQCKKPLLTCIMNNPSDRDSETVSRNFVRLRFSSNDGH
jgi:hypothetical protein